MSVNATSHGAASGRRSADERVTENKRRKRMRREFAAAWLVCGTIWFAGLGGLALAEEIGPAPLASGTTSYYRLDGSLSPFQDITGRYTVVVRSLSRAVSR